MTPSISIIIPVYNRAATIKRALDSVASQSFSDYEIIVVNDGSTDETTSIVEAVKSDKLKLLHHPQNRGAAAARNTGINAARGRWIAFLDSDDSWKPEKLARQIAVLEKSSSHVRACASGYHLHKDGRKLTISLKLSPKQFRREILFGCTISPGTTLIVDRRAFDELGGFDEELRRLEDWDWLLRFSERHDMAFVAEPLADINLTTQNTPQMDDHVRDAIYRIGMMHISHAEFSMRRMQLHSSLLVERAAMLHRRGRFVAAALTVLAALIVYPARNRTFFRTLWRSTSERFSRRMGRKTT